MINVFGVSPSPYVRKVLSCLELKGLPYTRKDIIPMHTPEDFIAISPLRKVPALQDGDLCLCDSTVICEYLDDAYTETPTRPVDIKKRAHARWLEEYADTKLGEVVTVIFFERFLKPTFLQQTTDEARVTKVIEQQMPAQLDYLQTQLPEQGFLFGEQLMVADVAVTNPFINAGYTDFAVDAERWPRLADYLSRVKAHPILEQRLQEEAEVMAQIR